MQKELKLAIWLGLAAVVSWFVARASVPPAPAQSGRSRGSFRKAKGNVWAKPVIYDHGSDAGTSDPIPL